MLRLGELLLKTAVGATFASTGLAITGFCNACLVYTFYGFPMMLILITTLWTSLHEQSVGTMPT